jgi:hypothetical protein
LFVYHSKSTFCIVVHGMDYYVEDRFEQRFPSEAQKKQVEFQVRSFVFSCCTDPQLHGRFSMNGFSDWATHASWSSVNGATG